MKILDFGRERDAIRPTTCNLQLVLCDVFLSYVLSEYVPWCAAGASENSTCPYAVPRIRKGRPALLRALACHAKRSTPNEL